MRSNDSASSTFLFQYKCQTVLYVVIPNSIVNKHFIFDRKLHFLKNFFRIPRIDLLSKLNRAFHFPMIIVLSRPFVSISTWLLFFLFILLPPSRYLLAPTYFDLQVFYSTISIRYFKIYVSFFVSYIRGNSGFLNLYLLKCNIPFNLYCWYSVPIRIRLVLYVNSSISLNLLRSFLVPNFSFVLLNMIEFVELHLNKKILKFTDIINQYLIKLPFRILCYRHQCIIICINGILHKEQVVEPLQLCL